MKILIFSAGFFPGKKCGGPPVSVDNFCTLMKDFECYIVATDHDMGETQRYKNIVDGWNNRENAKVMYLSSQEFSSYSCLEKIVLEVKPDCLYFQSLFQKCVLNGLRIAKKHNIKVMLAPRGELCEGAMRKKYKKVPYIFLLRSMGLTKTIDCQSTSAEETEAIRKWLNIPERRIHFLTNIPSIPRIEYERPTKVVHEAKFVFISRIHQKKNLLFALDCLRYLHGKVSFDIYGSQEDKDYWKRCEDLIRSLPSNISASYKGIVSHEDVHSVFSRYDAFVFPTLSENYGHVIAESLIVGCPVIISDQTPWNTVNDYNAGWAIPLSEKNEFINKMQIIIDQDSTQASSMSRNAIVLCKERLQTAQMHEMYLKAFTSPM